MKKTGLTQEDILSMVAALIQEKGFRTRAEMKATPEGLDLYRKLSNRGLVCRLDELLPKAGYGVAGVTESKLATEAYVRERNYKTRKQMKNDWGEGSLVYAALDRLEKLHWLDDVLPFRKQKKFDFQSYEDFQKYIQEKGIHSRTALATDRKEGAKLFSWIYREGHSDWLDKALPKKKLESKRDLTREDVEKFVIERGYTSRSEMKRDFLNGGSSMMSWLWKYQKTEWLDQVLPPHGVTKKEFTKEELAELVRRFNIKCLTDFTKHRETKVAYHWMRKERKLDLITGLLEKRTRVSYYRIEYTQQDVHDLIQQHSIKTRIEFSKHKDTRRVYAWLSYWRKLSWLDPYLPRYESAAKIAG